MDTKKGNSPRAYYPPYVVLTMCAAKDKLPLGRRLLQRYESILEILRRVPRLRRREAMGG